jgi:DUF4097 and DUF4098 domain-containing protein YvlB
MHTFPSPGPARLRVRIGHGRLVVMASDRDDVNVDVQPFDENNRHDREHAEKTTVEQRGDRILVEAPGDALRSRRAIDVRVTLPSGSHADIVVASADVIGGGRLGDVNVTTASGDIEFEQVASLEARSSSGDTACRRVDGRVTVTAASGDVVIGTAAGNGEFKTASGDLIVEEALGNIDARSASGDVIVSSLAGSADVRTASGGAHLRTVHAGTIAVNTTSGEIEVGVATGVAVWLDVESRSGELYTDLEDAAAPTGDQETVSIVARSVSGDITVLRASATKPATA